MLFEARNPFEARVVERLLEAAEGAGFRVQLAPVTPHRTTEVVVQELLEFRVEAMACFNPDASSPSLQHALATMPVVWLGERPGDPRADAVHADDVLGLRLVVEHLTGLGHRAICYAGGVGGLVGADRAEAYRDAMRAVGLADEIDVVSVGFLEESGAEAARALLARDVLPTAVIGCSDQVGAALVTVFAQAGVDVPGQVSVTGYDDSNLAAISYLSLTAVRQHVDVTVAATLAAIERRLADPRATPETVATVTSLTVRGSTGPARSSAV
ncbi:LacI family DNA-binding transcriptional regulator [Aestuariimicrobium soli]|uniref:LacI family DNA-binding transcriptional regulator n=1 Tax=Aestuariimicrobium soli TaxID=2035834 RepID=UPI003EB97121